MASHHATNKMKAAIDWCVHEYPAIDKIINKAKMPQEWIYEVCAKWGVNARTAREYLLIARAKIKIIEKERANESLETE